MTVYEDLVKTLKAEVQYMNANGILPYASRDLYEASALAIEQLLGVFPHRCELCIGCELEEPGGGCGKGFVLSITAAEEYIRGSDSSDEPERKRGHWKYQTMTVPGGKGQTYSKWSCSVCKHKCKERSRYCPACGSRMEEKK